MPNPTPRSYLGIAKETTKGTAVAATNYIPFRSPAPFDNYRYLEDQNLRGSMSAIYNELQGVVSSEYDFSGDAFPDTIGFLLMGIFGQVATTTASPLNTHVFTLYNGTDGQPPAYTFSDFINAGGNSGSRVRAFPGQQISDLSFKFQADGLVEYDCKSMGFPSAFIADPTASFTTVPPAIAWEGTTTIGGSNVVVLEDGGFNITRPVTPVFNVAGSQTVYKVWDGPMRIGGSLTFIHESQATADSAELVRYLTNTQPSLDVLFTEPGAGALAKTIQFHSNSAAYTIGKTTRGKDYLEVDVTYECVANTTDVGTSGGYGPGTVTIKNTISGY